MARRKNTVEIEDVTSTVSETAENSVKVEDSGNEKASELTDTAVENPVAEEKIESKVKANKIPEQEIPDNVKDILKVFSNYPELLVTPSGGVFTPGCKLAVAKAAILYKNPFYNA